MRKILIASIALFSFTLCNAQQQVNNILTEADSLFASKKFTESFQLYEQLLHVEKQASPAMLLRMSYIKEGLGDYSKALYYLNLYYLYTSDKTALRKMEELAESKKLEGYAFNDLAFVKAIFFKYFNHIVYSLLALSILMLAIMFHQKYRKHTKPIASGFGALIILALLFYTLNFGRSYNKGIVIKRNTYLMKGPSAGADVIAIIEKGHRLPINNTEDVWTTTEWQGQKAYIKSDKLMPVTFY